MLNLAIVRTVDFCARHSRWVIVAAFILAAALGYHAASHFAFDTNVNNLISRDLPWRQRDLEYQRAFPQSVQLILVAVEAPTPEQSAEAARALAENLSTKRDLFISVQNEGDEPFFQRSRFLFPPTEDVAKLTNQLARAQPLITVLGRDPSLRGLVQALSLGLEGVKAGQTSLDDLAPAFNMAASTLDNVASSRPASFSWQTLLQQKAGQQKGLIQLIEVRPVLDTKELAPGRKASDAISRSAAELKLAEEFGAAVRLTGPVPISDAEFASVESGLTLNSIVTSLIVLTILWLALRSFRLVVAIVVTLTTGLIITAGLGFLLVGALNPISIAFAVLFVGLGADFAVQFSLRYRAQRFESRNLRDGLLQAADYVGVPLSLAAAAAAAGFLSFAPTAYTGLAQLGKIAGCGMAVAYITSFTLLPAMLTAVAPPEESKPLRQPALAPVDRFLQRRRILVISLTALLALAAAPSLLKLQFDFNPLHLQRKSSPAVAALLQLSREGLFNPNAADILAHSPEDAAAISEKLKALPEVGQVRTIESFIPTDQKKKLLLIREAERKLSSALQAPLRPAPTDAENVEALRTAAQRLETLAGEDTGEGGQAAKRLSADLSRLSEANVGQRNKAGRAFLDPLKMDLQSLRLALHPNSVDLNMLPRSLVRDWVAPDGSQRVEAIPKAGSDDDAALSKFGHAVLKVAPGATGQAVQSLEWASTMIRALIEAAVLAFCVIAFLLWISLRRLGDVLLTLVPLVVAALATLEICALTRFKLNYANIIALPVLLGIGVAFKIYYITAWRRGQTDFLQTALTRAVFFSALLTGAAFGSLAISQNPGMSSMGALLALSLACTLASAVLFQPALMGKPRSSRK